MPDEVLYPLMLVFAYVLPTLVAWGREHRSALAITFVNLALGWTALGWIVAMVWSLTGNVKEKAPARR